MFENLDVFRMSSAMARHAGQRQALISQNVANADTPGFKGREMPPFASLYASADTAGVQRATRAQHLNGAIQGTAMASREMRGGDSPNGNGISLETELLKSAEVKSHHDRALTIYKSALDVLRATIGK